MTTHAKAALLSTGMLSRQMLPSDSVRFVRHSTRAVLVIKSNRQSDDPAIVSTPDVLGGKPRIAGRRIAVQHIAVWHDQMGMSEAEIAREYNLTSQEIRAALDFYAKHRAEIDEAIRAEDARNAALREQITGQRNGG